MILWRRFVLILLLPFIPIFWVAVRWTKYRTTFKEWMEGWKEAWGR